MNGAKVSAHPDTEWCRALKEGDRVGVAEYGRLVYVGVVVRRTPKGLLKVFHESSVKAAGGVDLRDAEVFYAECRRDYRIGWANSGNGLRTRYLVPAPAAAAPEADHG